MRIESIRESRWGERRNRRWVHLQQEALAGARTASMARAEWVWEKGLENVPSAGFQKRKILYLFFLWMFKFWQILTFEPIKIQEGKKEKKIASFKEEKDNKHAHSCKNKIHPKKPLWKCIWALKNRSGLECGWCTGHGMTIKCGIPTGSQACVC